MTWFELRSPQKITLMPAVADVPSNSQSLVDLDSIIKGRDGVFSYERSASSNTFYSLVFKDIKSPPDTAVADGFAETGPGVLIASGLSSSQSQNRADLLYLGRSSDKKLFDVVSRVVNYEDGRYHIIAALLDRNLRVEKRDAFPVEANISDPYLVPIYIDPNESSLTKYTDKYYTVERTSGGEASGDFTVTFRRLSMSTTPYVVVKPQTVGSVYHSFVDSVTTGGFRVKTWSYDGATPVDSVLGGYVLFSGTGGGQRGRGIVKFPHRRAVALAGFGDKAVTSGSSAYSAPQFSNLFSSITDPGTGLLNFILKSSLSDEFTAPGIAVIQGMSIPSLAFANGLWGASNEIHTRMAGGTSITAVDRALSFLAINWGDRTNY